MLSQGALQAVLASATSQVFLETLTISHSKLPTIRLVNDNQDLVRAAGTFSRFPFRVTAPPQTSERPPAIQFVATTVDQTVITGLRQLAGQKERATITYEVVLAATPDVVEFGPVSFEFSSAKTSNLTDITVEGTFLRGALNDQFPGTLIAPSNAT